jgi:hypothetical protein
MVEQLLSSRESSYTGFLEIHMLASLQSPNGPLKMEAVGQRDVDAVNAGVIKKLCVPSLLLAMNN